MTSRRRVGFGERQLATRLSKAVGVAGQDCQTCE